MTFTMSMTFALSMTVTLPRQDVAPLLLHGFVECLECDEPEEEEEEDDDTGERTGVCQRS